MLSNYQLMKSYYGVTVARAKINIQSANKQNNFKDNEYSNIL